MLSADNAIGSLQDINTVRYLQKPNAILGSESGHAVMEKTHIHTSPKTDEEPKLKHLLSDIE